MYLDGILGSRTKVNLLSVLVQSPERGVIESELAKLSGSSTSEINRQINDLVTIGLVSLTRVGRSKLYQINQTHFLYKPLSLLFRSLDEIYREIAMKITSHVTKDEEVKTVILIGSLERGNIKDDYISKPSDLDLVFIVEDELLVKPVRDSILDYAAQEIFPTYGINAYPIVLSESEYLSGLIEDPFIMNVHSAGETLYGEKPRKFG